MAKPYHLEYRESFCSQLNAFLWQWATHYNCWASTILAGAAAGLLERYGTRGRDSFVIPGWFIACVLLSGPFVAAFLTWRDDRMLAAEEKNRFEFELQEKEKQIAEQNLALGALQLRLDQKTTKLLSAEAKYEKESADKSLRQIEKRNALDRFITVGHAILERLKRGDNERPEEFERWVSELTTFGTKLRLSEIQVVEEATDDVDGAMRTLSLVSGCSGLPTERAICHVADMLIRIETLRDKLQD